MDLRAIDVFEKKLYATFASMSSYGPDCPGLSLDAEPKLRYKSHVTFFGLEVRRPQVFGGLLLLALAVGAGITSRKTPLSPDELQLLKRSVEITAPIKPELRKDPVADSILLYRVTRVFEPSFDQLQSRLFAASLLRWLPTLYRLPFLLFGLWLGCALWCSSRPILTM